MRTLQEILTSISDIMLPDELGEATVFVTSRGYDDDTALHVVLWQNDIEAARVLIEAGADANAIGEMGETPLHVAVSKELIEAVELLLSHGANPDAVSEFGVSPRQVAESEGGALAALFSQGGA